MTLAEFLWELATNPKEFARYSESRERFIDESDLSDEHKAILRAGELRDVRVLVEAEFTVGEETMMIHTICVPTICVPKPGPPGPPSPDSDDYGE